MFIERIGTNPFEISPSTENNTTDNITPVVKKTYSFVGSNDVDENIDTSELTFNENEINTSLEKAGSSTNQENNTKSSASNNTTDSAEIAEIDKEIASLESELSSLANTKYTQMKNEDENGQYLTEQKENEINSQLKELKLKKYNLERNNNVSAEELSLYSYSLDMDFRLNRIDEKRSYLNEKNNELATSYLTAIKNEDAYQQYVIEQQQNAIAALDKIFEIDETNIKEQLDKLKNELEILNTEPIKSTDNNNADKKSLLETIQQQIELSYKTIQLSSDKSLAIQNEDNNKLNEVEQQENSLNAQDKEHEISKQKLIAKLNGKELSDEEITSVSKKHDCEVKYKKILAIRQHIDYKLIKIASAKTTAMQNEDEYQLYILEQYENKLNRIYNKLDGVCGEIEKEISNGSDAALDRAIEIADKYQNVDISAPISYSATSVTTEVATTVSQTVNSTSEPICTTGEVVNINESKEVGGTVTIGQTSTKTIKEEEAEPYTENDGTFSFKGKKLYRNGQKYTGEFEGKIYKNGKLFKGKLNGIRYKNGVKFSGKRLGKLYVNGELAQGEVDGKMYNKGKLLKGLATYTPYKEDGKTPDTQNAVTTYYKKGVKATGKYKGKLYVDGALFTGTYKNKTYVNGIRQK